MKRGRDGGRTLRILLLRRRSRCLLLLVLLLLRGFRAGGMEGKLVSGCLERYLYCGIIMMNMRRMMSREREILTAGVMVFCPSASSMFTDCLFACLSVKHNDE